MHIYIYIYISVCVFRCPCNVMNNSAGVITGMSSSSSSSLSSSLILPLEQKFIAWIIITIRFRQVLSEPSKASSESESGTRCAYHHAATVHCGAAYLHRQSYGHRMAWSRLRSQYGPTTDMIDTRSLSMVETDIESYKKSMRSYLMTVQVINWHFKSQQRFFQRNVHFSMQIIACATIKICSYVHRVSSIIRHV